MDPLLTIEELVRDFDTPNQTGWKLFTKMDTLTVYRRIHQKLFHYKCISHIPDVSPDIFYQVALNVEYRVVWDKFLKEGRNISDGNKHGMYWLVVMPLFISNRDYTFVLNNKEFDLGNRHFYYVSSHCEPFQNEPPRKKVIRIEQCQSQALICSDGEQGLRGLFYYSEDPRGSIPKAAWSWAAKFGIPMYAKLTYNACKAYPQWIKDKKITLPNEIQQEIDSATAEAEAAAATVAMDESADNDLENNDNQDEDEYDNK